MICNYLLENSERGRWRLKCMLGLKNSSKINNKHARIGFNPVKFKKNLDLMIMHILEGKIKNNLI